MLNRHRFADDHWNQIAAHADRLRAENEALREALAKFLAFDADDSFGVDSATIYSDAIDTAAALLAPNAELSGAGRE